MRPRAADTPDHSGPSITTPSSSKRTLRHTLPATRLSSLRLAGSTSSPLLATSKERIPSRNASARFRSSSSAIASSSSKSMPENQPSRDSGPPSSSVPSSTSRVFTNRRTSSSSPGASFLCATAIFSPTPRCETLRPLAFGFSTLRRRARLVLRDPPQLQDPSPQVYLPLPARSTPPAAGLPREAGVLRLLEQL